MLKFYSLFSIFLSLFLAACSGPKKTGIDTVSVERGRYLSIISGCNDCHTPGWTLKPFQIPESEWLTGSDVGFNGPWGTTYPTNLRLYFSKMPEDAWVKFVKNLKSRPPMPWWILHEFSEADSRSLHRFISQLGPAGKAEPAFVPAGQKPQTQVFEFFPQEPK